MSKIDEHNKRGFANAYSATSPYNAIDFQIKQALRQINTSFIARIDSCTSTGSDAGSGSVDATPLTAQIDGEGNAVPTTSIPGLPHTRLQFGVAAVIIDPVPGDIAVFSSCKSDISTVNSGTQEAQRPGSFREFDQSDAVMVGAVHTKKPQIFIQLNQDLTLNIVAPQGITINTDADVVLNAGGNLTASVAGNAQLSAGGSVEITAPQTTINGPLTVTGAITGQGGLAISGGSGATVQGSLTTTGDVVAGGISLDNHTHSGVQSGDGSTGKPQ